MFADFYIRENSIYERSNLDNSNRIIYNVFIMNNQTVPNEIVREADNLSKETGISFRDCLEVLYKAYQDLRYGSIPILVEPQRGHEGVRGPSRRKEETCPTVRKSR